MISLKKIIAVSIVAFALLACAATKPIDTKSCIALANTVKNNEATSGNEVYQQCVDNQDRQNEAKKGFWGKSAEGLLFLVIDMVSS